MTDLPAPKSLEGSQTYIQARYPSIPFPGISTLVYLIINSLTIH